MITQLNAQTTIFQENWDGQGPGISAWTLYNVDNKTPVGPAGTDGEALSFLIQDAWNVLSLADIQGANSAYTAYPAAATGMAGNIIASNSWYTPAGIANDWLVSPQINIPTGATNVNLTWSATSLGDTAFLEDYKVYISTTGNQVANFTTILKNVQNEPNTGNTHTVNISSYAGQNVRIAFRNDGNDQYVMFLDNIKIAANNVLATDEVSKSKTDIYPNPTKGEINIKTDKKIKSFTVFDLSGKVLLQSSSEKLNISSFAKGTYLVKVEFADGSTKTEKVIKD
ncbi:T9SS type A sorting domain-containing protein [Chryseobacterium aquaticum]|uniref:T9SS type A sorting domain-containing protein n=1 Tax=Chryseobacterium aquaticum TaxID=452084 RepID=A0A848MZY6_9FLAO|nr:MULTISPECIES: choice-of-anchor J domain-containing protein [Chryseobacterium]NMR33666.1 T9SS type A sorting domain-containing protein [Chryseobacterium aquaticum]NRQ45740.1 T9SS type A sorting domain-containing protein [Chryseobacterium sp. C-204]